mgnify:FL=1
MASRLAPEPAKQTHHSDHSARPPKQEKKRSRALILIAVLCAVLLALYCALCAFGGSGDTLRDGTAVNGINIGGMTKEQAVSALTEQLAGTTSVEGTDYSAIDVVPDIPDAQTYTVDLSGCLSFDVTDTVEQAWAHDHGGMFLSRGIRFLTSLGGGKSYHVAPQAADAAQVRSALEATGILTLNTTTQTTYALTDTTLDFTMGVSGVSVDENALIQKILDNTAKGDYSSITCEMVSADPDPVDMPVIHDALYAEPANATLEVADDGSYTVTDSVQGIDFDVAEAQSILSAAQPGETVSVPLNRQAPAIDTATLKANLFKDVLGEYTTSVSGTADRRSNVQLAAQKCSGTILLPGEVFAYNQVVGQRTEAAGFKKAGAYSNGETVQELGGGVCQDSSTLYCAALYANLEIVERHNHSYVSSYVPIGMDATVSWGGPDFQFRNNTDYPIKVVASYANSKVTFQIVGTKTDDYSVKITTETISTTAPTVQEVPDDTLEAGTTQVADKGHTGYKVQSYRHVYDANGNVVYEGKESLSSYKMTPKVIHVGTKVAETPAPDTPVTDTPAADTPTPDTPAA